MSLGKDVDKILSILEGIDNNVDKKRKYYTYMKTFKNQSITDKIQNAIVCLDLLLGEIYGWIENIDYGLTAEKGVFSWDTFVEEFNRPE